MKAERRCERCSLSHHPRNALIVGEAVAQSVEVGEGGRIQAAPPSQGDDPIEANVNHRRRVEPTASVAKLLLRKAQALLCKRELFGGAGDQQLIAIRNHILAKCSTQLLVDESPPGAKETRVMGILQRFRTAQINQNTIGGFIAELRQHGREPSGRINVAGGGGRPERFHDQNFKLPDYTNTTLEFEVLGEAIDLALLYEEAHGNRQIRIYCSQMVTP